MQNKQGGFFQPYTLIALARLKPIHTSSSHKSPLGDIIKDQPKTTASLPGIMYLLLLLGTNAKVKNKYLAPEQAAGTGIPHHVLWPTTHQGSRWT